MILRNSFSLSIVRKLRFKIKNDKVFWLFVILLFPFGVLKGVFESLRKEEQSDFKYKLCAVSIIKNEGDYIEEWIEFYRVMGFDKIVLYDNESTDNTKKLIKKYVDDGFVDYFYYPGKKRQFDAYNDAIYKYKNQAEYMIMIDADEFLYSTNPSDEIYEIVKSTFESDNKAVGGCVVNWLCYGSNGHLTKPKGLVIDNYLMRGEDNFRSNKNYKTIVNPRRVVAYVNPHFPVYKKHFYGVTTSLKKVIGFINDGDYSKLRINHYFTKSKEEYISKMQRGEADKSDKRSMDEFYLHDVNDIYDDSLKRYCKDIDDKIKHLTTSNLDADGTHKVF